MSIPILQDPTKGIVDLGSQKLYGPKGRYECHPGPYHIQDLSKLDKIFPGVMDGKNPNPMGERNVYGEISKYERELLARIVLWKNPRFSLEFGTSTGVDTKVIAEFTQEKVITVDLPDNERTKLIYTSDSAFMRPEGDKLGEAYKNSEIADKVIQVEADINTKECAKTIEGHLGTNKLDLVFIDPAHDPLTTLNAWDIAYQNLADNAIVLLHDYSKLESHVGVTRVVSELATNEGFIFYYPRPDRLKGKQTSEHDYSLIFYIHVPEAKRDWGKMESVNERMRNRPWHKKTE